MTAKPRRQPIRTAPKPGARVQERPLRPEEDVAPTGERAEASAPYEAYAHYYAVASEKLGKFKGLVEDVYQMLDAGKVQEAKQALIDFDRSLPKLDRGTA